MKARMMTALVAIASVMLSFTLSAEHQYINSGKKLDKKKTAIFDYTKNLLASSNDVIKLPQEINMLIGDTANMESYKAVPQWDEAYFEDGKYKLVVPLVAESPIGKVHSSLSVSMSGTGCYRLVVTKLPETAGASDSDKFSGITVNSNVFGIFLRAFVYKNGEITEQFEGNVGNMGYFDSHGSAGRKSR